MEGDNSDQDMIEEGNAEAISNDPADSEGNDNSGVSTPRMDLSPAREDTDQSSPSANEGRCLNSSRANTRPEMRDNSSQYSPRSNPSLSPAQTTQGGNVGDSPTFMNLKRSPRTEVNTLKRKFQDADAAASSGEKVRRVDTNPMEFGHQRDADWRKQLESMNQILIIAQNISEAVAENALSMPFDFEMPGDALSDLAISPQETISPDKEDEDEGEDARPQRQDSPEKEQ